MYLVSPTDRELLAEFKSRDLNAISSSIPERYGADVLTAVSGKGKVAVQRKHCPDDLIASTEDGRMTREVALLKYAEYPIFLIEGWPLFTADGHILDKYLGSWTKRRLRNLMRSIWVTQGIPYERTDSIQDTVDAILEIEAHVRNPKHSALFTRPKAPAKDSWGTANKRDFARFFLQGMPGVGATLAQQIFDKFGRVPLQWTCTEDEMRQVIGIGPKRAKTLMEMLE